MIRALQTALVSCLIAVLPPTAQSDSPPGAPGLSLTLDEANERCRKVLKSHQCPPSVLPICQQAASLAEKTLGYYHVDTAESLNNVSECYLHGGQYKQAEQVTRHSLEIQRKLLGEEHNDVANSLNTLAASIQLQGRYVEAAGIYHRVLAIWKKLLGVGHPNVADVLNNVATLLDLQGKYDQAEKVHRQALMIRQKLFGREHQTVAQSLYNLAHVLSGQGKYSEAEGLYRQALLVRQKLYGGVHPDIATSIDGLASALENQGNRDVGESLRRHALLIRQKLFIGEHPAIATSLNNLAVVLETQGKHAEAERLHRQALLMLQNMFGHDHPHVAASLNNLAYVLDNMENYDEAERIARHALLMWQKLVGSEHPNVARSINNLAHVIFRQGKVSEAEVLHRQALSMWKRLLGSDHPDVAICLGNLGLSLISQSKQFEAMLLLGQAVTISEKQLRTVVSEARIWALLSQERRYEDWVYGLLLDTLVPGASDLAIRMALLRKGRAQEAGALANRVAHRSIGTPSVKQRFEEWITVRQQREFLLYGGLGKLTPEAYQKQLQELQLQADSLEHALARELPELSKLHPPSLEEIIPTVAKRLPPNGVLVEVVWTRRFQGWGRADKQAWGAPHYVAMLLFPDQRIVAVDLGEAATMEGLAATFLQALALPSSDPKPAAQKMYTALFDKLGEHLAGKREVFLSLDGSLNLIPFDALHDGNDYLLGRYRFHYLTSGRDLLRQPSQQPVGPALVLGNPYVGTAQATGSQKEESFYEQVASLPDLPWAQREAETVGGLLGVRALLGTGAKEETLRGQLAPRVLHLATHGIFVSDLEPWMVPGGRSALLEVQMPGSIPRPNAPPVRLPGQFSSMNRSALLLANVRGGATVEDKTKDGLLTAEEARSLNLDGTQLVVLSACNTGRGDTANGQGVYGLRRAFLVAGAETVVTSLWRIDDEATSELIKQYYTKLLDKAHPGDRLDAMLDSMKELRALPRRSHPYYWAPFLVIGADGPLRAPARP